MSRAFSRPPGSAAAMLMNARSAVIIPVLSSSSLPHLHQRTQLLPATHRTALRRHPRASRHPCLHRSHRAHNNPSRHHHYHHHHLHLAPNLPRRQLQRRQCSRQRIALLVPARPPLPTPKHHQRPRPRRYRPSAPLPARRVGRTLHHLPAAAPRQRRARRPPPPHSPIRPPRRATATRATRGSSRTSRTSRRTGPSASARAPRWASGWVRRSRARAS